MTQAINEQDLNLLLEALDVWVDSEQMQTTLFAVFGAVLSGSQENTREFLEDTKADRENTKANRKIREERATLLKAKLIQIRDSLGAQSFEDEALKR